MPAQKKPKFLATGPGLRPDARYNSLLVAKFINCLMLDGKKSTAERLFYDALEQIANKLKIDPLNVFEEAIDNAKPHGGSALQARWWCQLPGAR